MYGDVTRSGILDACGIGSARAVVISFDDHAAALKTLARIRGQYPELPVLVRTADDSHLEALIEAGATDAVPDTLEASLMLGAQLLLVLGVPARDINQRTDAIRADRYKLLRGMFRRQTIGVGDG